MTTHAGSGIVVGIEGTVASRGALEWAMREAAERGCRLTVVHAWDHLPARSAGRMSEHEERRASVCMIAAEVASAARDCGVTPDVVERSIKGAPAKVLIAAAADAELLVIGRGHRSGIVDVLRQSVSAECVRHAACPVVVVPVADHVEHPAQHSVGVSG